MTDPAAERIASIERMAQEQDDPDRVLAEITWLITERVRLRAALAFYATAAPLSCRLTTPFGDTEGQVSIGEVARDALRGASSEGVTNRE